MNTWHLLAEGHERFLAEVAFVATERFKETEVFCLRPFDVLCAYAVSLLRGHPLEIIGEIGSLRANFSAHTDLPLRSITPALTGVPMERVVGPQGISLSLLVTVSPAFMLSMIVGDQNKAELCQ